MTDNDLRRQDLRRQAVIWWYNAATLCATEWKELKHDKKMSGKECIMRHLDGHSVICRERYRLSSPNFRLLCDELRARGLECKGDLIIEEQVGMFLQMVGQGAVIRKIAEDFQHSEETVWRSISRVLRCVLRMIPDYMKLPDPDAPIHPKLRAGTEFYPFKDALGAIDGTHISAFPDCKETFTERFRNRRGKMTQNVMAAVDFDGNFMAVVAGWEGSARDNLILRRAVEKGFRVPEGRYYLVDREYANTDEFISPYRGSIYHLAQFRARHQENQYDSKEELFNHRHAQLRNVVDKAFDILKNRFKICKEMCRFKYNIQRDIVIACCLLHNFIKRHQSLQGESDDEICDVELDSDIPSASGNDPIVEQYRGADAQVRGQLRDKIRDMLWDAR